MYMNTHHAFFILLHSVGGMAISEKWVDVIYRIKILTFGKYSMSIVIRYLKTFSSWFQKFFTFLYFYCSPFFVEQLLNIQKCNVV